MNFLSLFAIVCTTFVGLIYYIRIAQRQKNDRIEKFFLAGRNIGVSLFENTTWASSNGAANSIFYALWLGYTLGLAGIWLQAFWCAGVYTYSYLIPKIVTHTEKFTLHGFLGAYYGNGTRFMASFVSLTGLFVCIGFEISYISSFYTQVLGFQKEYILPLIFAFSIFISVFCTIGGFSANAITDKISNRFATFSVFVVIFFLIWYTFQHQVPIKDASIVPLTHNHWSFYVGIIFFGLYQFIDMTNWQTVSANSIKHDKKSVVQMQRGLRKAAIMILLFPVTTGTIAGFLLRNISNKMQQETILSAVTKDYLPVLGGHADLTTILSLIFLCLICFSFFASSLSATDSWLLASSQTISWDLADYKLFKHYNFRVADMSDQEHKMVLRRARLYLIIIGIVVTGLIYYISQRWNEVFALQFVMFGAGTSMVPALVYGLYFCRTYKEGMKYKWTAFISITVGFFSAIALFIISLVLNNSDIVNYIPFTTFGLSASIIFFGVLITKSQSLANENN